MDRSKRKKISKFEEVDNMDPIEKYEKFGRFPYKMIIHILLVIFTTVQAVQLVAESNRYSRSQERFLYNMFIDDSDKRAVDYHRVNYLYSVDDIRQHLNASLNNFYNLKTKSLEIVKFNQHEPKVQMEFRYIDNKKVKVQIDKNEDSPHTKLKKRFDYVVCNKTLGPFDYPDDEVKTFLNDVVEFRLNYSLRTYVPYFYNNYYDCNLWSVDQVYNFASRAHFIVRLNILRLACEDLTDDHSYTELFINKLLWIHIIVLILAAISLILTYNYIQWISSLYMKVKFKHRQKFQRDDESQYTKSEDSIYYNPLLDENLRKQLQDEIKKVEKAEMLSLESGYPVHQHNKSHTWIRKSQSFISESPSLYKFNLDEVEKKKEEKAKTPVFNSWSLICLTGNVVQIFASSISIFETTNILPSTEVLVGFGCMLAYLNIGRYIEYAENYSAIYVTIKSSLPNVSRYLLGVFPIFLGFIFFGLCIFWRSERFTNTSDVTIILFALAQGDSIWDTFKDLSGVYFLIGQIYLYLFCIIFIVVVLNIFIAIIEEAYVTSKMENKTHWVFDYIKRDKTKKIQLKPAEETKPKAIADKPSRPILTKEHKPQTPTANPNQKKRVSFGSHPSRDFKVRSFQEASYRFSEEDEIKQIQLQRQIEDEFGLIEQDMQAILQLSLDIKKSEDDQMIDEIRILVLERINS